MKSPVFPYELCIENKTTLYSFENFYSLKDNKEILLAGLAAITSIVRILAIEYNNIMIAILYNPEVSITFECCELSNMTFPILKWSVLVQNKNVYTGNEGKDSIFISGSEHAE